ncbi:Uncharacterised protein [Serratia grimesii]|uniref:hypothetical protein n=1 Tax=Serratia grimesii TaxID=82995 RepID=UPI00076F3E32|nr:hypothetical protein [Serratia grimesii]CUW11912.1 Uncharacterised protein [Serratia grimesii]SMZ56203.1 Uncharacterised protein [Serratia grimesii]
MLVAKIKLANGKENGCEIKEWWRDADGTVRLKKYDDTIDVVELSENDIVYITDTSESGNTIAVYR